MSAFYIIPNLSEMNEIEELRKKYGLHYEFNEFYRPSVLDDKQEQLRIINEYSKYCDNFAADTIHGAFLDVTVHSSDSLIREVSEKRIIQSMEIAKEMGARGVVLHSGLIGGFHLESYEKLWLSSNVDFFKRIADRYGNIDIYMENMFDDGPALLAALAHEMREVPNFGICFDYAHGSLSDTVPANWMAALSPYIKHMHINDNDLQNDLHLPVGDGKTDWNHYAALMKEYDYAGSTLIEVQGYEAIQRSLAYMEARRGNMR